MTIEEFKKFLVDNNICVRSQFYKPLRKIDLYFTKKDGFKYKYTIEDSNLSGIDVESIDYSYVWTYLTDSADHDRIINNLKDEISKYNKSNDVDITIDEFKKFLEKNRINIDISHRRDIGILTGKFYISYGNILDIYEVKSGLHSIYQMEYDVLLDLFISLLAKKENLTDVRDALVSVLAGDSEQDDYEICEVKSPDTQKEIEGRLEEAEIANGKEASIREETLDAAKKCVMGDREQDYGTPESNFATIASFWSDYLDMDISAQQVADMMILMKISRIKNGGGTGDSYVDIAGYAACGNEILNKAHK